MIAHVPMTTHGLTQPLFTPASSCSYTVITAPDLFVAELSACTFFFDQFSSRLFNDDCQALAVAPCTSDGVFFYVRMHARQAAFLVIADAFVAPVFLNSH